MLGAGVNKQFNSAIGMDIIEGLRAYYFITKVMVAYFQHFNTRMLILVDYVASIRHFNLHLETSQSSLYLLLQLRT